MSSECVSVTACSIHDLLGRSGRPMKPQEGGQRPDTLGEGHCLEKGLEALISLKH